MYSIMKYLVNAFVFYASYLIMYVFSSELLKSCYASYLIMYVFSSEL